MELPSFLRYLFLVHFVVALAYGVWFFTLPQTWVDLTGWPYYDPLAGRVMASMLIGLGIASLLCYRANSWDKAEIIVVTDIIWLLLGSLGLIWSMIENFGIPIAGGLNLAVMLILLVLFVYAYYDVRVQLKPEIKSPLRS
ncbi:MAG: hypothetical protein ACFE7R_11910 [Candidatus Hodarchaeota archaeon]